MAVIKHISVKGSNGGDALNYVLYKHNEKTGELIVDGRGNPIMRDEYYLDGINCEPYSFAAECRELNDQYGKNQLPGDIKAHHFIISYDPKDEVNHGLTGPKAQQLSMEWAERCLPGFQILVCTHMDGSNESGNIHTHIMMNSVRKYDTNSDDYGERAIDHLAGYKLHLTDDFLHYMKQELMTICKREGLCQIDLLSPAKDRITNREYRAQQNGQDYLDKRYEIDGCNPEKTTFQTQKQYLRESVMDVASRATSFDEFCIIMKEEYDITVKESRGRISYLHPDREKYITGRALGLSYKRESIIQTINGEIEAGIIDGKGTENIADFSLGTLEECNEVFEMHTDLHLVVRLQDCAKARTSGIYANKTMMSNVRAMAETILFVQHHGFKSVDDIKEELRMGDNKYLCINADIQECCVQLKETNELIYLLGEYFKTKEINKQFLHASDKKAFSKSHQVELERYKNTLRAIKYRYKKQIPSLKDLKEQKEKQLKTMESLKEQKLKTLEYTKKLKIIDSNINMMIGKDRTIDSRGEQKTQR